MYKQERTTAAPRRKQVYNTPVVESLQARVERGFASSGILGESTGEGTHETGNGDNSLFT